MERSEKSDAQEMPQLRNRAEGLGMGKTVDKDTSKTRTSRWICDAFIDIQKSVILYTIELVMRWWLERTQDTGYLIWT